jgi:hypothetical protein
MLKAALVFGVGYVLGAKAGQERYEQIQQVAKKATDELNKRAAHDPRRSSA